MAPRLRHPKPQPDPVSPLAGLPPAQEGGRPRFAVRIERHSPRTLDKTNLYGGVKALEDCLRRAAIIPDDDPATIDLTVEQVKVPRGHEGTRIIVTPLP